MWHCIRFVRDMRLYPFFSFLSLRFGPGLSTMNPRPTLLPNQFATISIYFRMWRTMEDRVIGQARYSFSRSGSLVSYGEHSSFSMVIRNGVCTGTTQNQSRMSFCFLRISGVMGGCGWASPILPNHTTIVYSTPAWESRVTERVVAVQVPEPHDGKDKKGL